MLSAVALLLSDRYREIFVGLLATIDVRSDPVASYRALAALGPPALEFLLPHGTHDEPPPGAARGDTPYADWLTAVYEAWLAGRRARSSADLRVHPPDLLGLSSLTEALGTEASDIVVIETDGTIEQADSIKVAYDGAPVTGLDIFRHPLDAAAAHPAIVARQQGVAGLSATCRRCPVVASCGGGLYAHRYRAGTGYDNPSVYCADLVKIITHVRSGLGTAPAPRPCGLGTSICWPATSELGRLTSFPRATSTQDRGGLRRRCRRRVARRSAASALSAVAAARNCFARWASERADGAFLAGWELLDRLQEDHHAAFAEVLAHPYVRAWAERCLLAATKPDGGPAPLPPEAGHLAAIAAAVAVKAGALAEIDVPVVGGYLALLHSLALAAKVGSWPPPAPSASPRAASRCAPTQISGMYSWPTPCRTPTGSLSASCGPGTSRSGWKTPTRTGTATSGRPRRGCGTRRWRSGRSSSRWPGR